MNWDVWSIATLIWLLIAYFLGLSILRRSKLAKFRPTAVSQLAAPACVGRDWKHAFPNASNSSIRDYCGLIVDAFMLPKSYLLKLPPRTPLAEIYKAVTTDGIDNFEYETLELLIDKQYKISLISIWRDDLTLGDLFQVVQEQGQQAAQAR